MEPAEISLLLLRHLARDGCTETIKTYMTECPVLKESLGMSFNGGIPDLDNFRQKLLNRSVNMSLIDLLSEYGRAKSMIHDLVTKLLYEWKTLSTYFLSPHDSMATQLAHITKFLETKCKSCQTDTKCIGTSDYPDMLELLPPPPPPPQASTSTVCMLQHTTPPVPSQDIAVQTSEADEEEATDLPNIVNSLLDPPVIDKIVQIANKELNRSSHSTENPNGNDTETEIDKMLLDILHGIGGGTPLPSNALTAGCNNPDSVSPASLTVEPQLMALFQDAQSIIVNTPIPGTLGRPEESASKHRPCGSFLDLIETPFKSAFLSNPNTPIVKSNNLQPPAVDPNLEKLNCRTVELNFGSLAPTFGPPIVPFSSSQTPSLIKSALQQLGRCVPKPKASNVPKYSVIKPEEAKHELERLRRKRDIRPKIPVIPAVLPSNEALQQTQDDSVQLPIVVNNPALSRSASKRKFSTPVKLLPGRAMHSSVNFYCSSSSQDRLDREVTTPKPDKSSGAPDTPYQIPRSSSIATPDKESTFAFNANITNGSEVTSESCQKAVLATINYDDLGCSVPPVSSKSTPVPITTSTGPTVAVAEPALVLNSKPCEQTSSISSAVTLQFDKVKLLANAKTPDSCFSEKDAVQKDNGGSPQIVYNRLLASVRHSRPTNLMLHKKSFSTPRKKGHIRNLMFKTPPGAQSERTENSSVLSLEDSIRSLKRKGLSPSPNSSQPLGTRSKKRLKWTTPVPEVELSEIVVAPPCNIVEPNITLVHTPATPVITSTPAFIAPVQAKVSMEEIASKVVLAPHKNAKGRGGKGSKVADASGTSSKSKAARTKELKSKQQSANESTAESTRSRTRSKRNTKAEQEQSSGGASLVSPLSTTTTPSPVTKPSRRKNAKFDDFRAAEAAVVDAVPLGSRKTPLPKYRVTRGKGNLPVVIQDQVTSTPNKVDTSSLVKDAAKSTLPILHPGDALINAAPGSSQQKSDTLEPPRRPQPQPSQSTIATKGIPPSPQKIEVADNQKSANHAYKTRNAVKGKGKEGSLARIGISSTIEIVLDDDRTSEVVLKSKTLDTSSSNDADKDIVDDFEASAITGTQTLQVSSEGPQQLGEIPVLRIEEVHVDVSSPSGLWSPRTNDSNLFAPILTGKDSPPKGRPKSPKKGHQHQGKVPPRRILPKPVPPDYPRVAFPPATQNSGYILSIPSSTPTKDDSSDGQSLGLRPSFISPITTATVIVTTPPKVPKLSSDSSSDFNSSSVPKTPRLKNDSGEESCSMSMHSRLFLGLGDRNGPTGAGMPIFSSTPLKFGVPQTPGKTIATQSIPIPIVATEGENSTQSQSSLFDTPVKIDSPLKALSHPATLVQTHGQLPSLDILPEISFTPRKSPRKSVHSPLKTPLAKKTPRKGNVPIKSVQKLPTKPLYEFKPIRRTPYKSPLRVKANSNMTALPENAAPSPNLSSTLSSSDVASSMEKSTRNSNSVVRSSAATGTIGTPVNNSQDATKIVSTSSGFSSLFTKAKSLMRLSEGAKRRLTDAAAISSNVNGSKRVDLNSGTSPIILPSKPLLASQQQSHSSRSDPTPPKLQSDVRAEGKVKTNKHSDVHFQFAVSGRTKQLSLSEHESLLGLLQIGSLNSQGKKQVQHSQSSQGLETDLLSSIDLHKFLRTVHAGD